MLRRKSTDANCNRLIIKAEYDALVDKLAKSGNWEQIKVTVENQSGDKLTS